MLVSNSLSKNVSIEYTYNKEWIIVQLGDSSTTNTSRNFICCKMYEIYEETYINYNINPVTKNVQINNHNFPIMRSLIKSSLGTYETMEDMKEDNAEYFI